MTLKLDEYVVRLQANEEINVDMVEDISEHEYFRSSSIHDDQNARIVYPLPAHLGYPQVPASEGEFSSPLSTPVQGRDSRATVSDPEQYTHEYANPNDLLPVTPVDTIQIPIPVFTPDNDG